MNDVTTTVRVSKNNIRYNEVVITDPTRLGEKLIDLRKRYPEHTFRLVRYSATGHTLSNDQI